jgi:hypothetical protein
MRRVPCGRRVACGVWLRAVGVGSKEGASSALPLQGPIPSAQQIFGRHSAPSWCSDSVRLLRIDESQSFSRSARAKDLSYSTRSQSATLASQTPRSLRGLVGLCWPVALFDGTVAALFPNMPGVLQAVLSGTFFRPRTAELVPHASEARSYDPAKPPASTSWTTTRVVAIFLPILNAA